MSDQTATCKVTLKPEAADFLQSLPAPVKCALIDFIRTEARRADKQMVVLSLTCDGTWPWIERAMKWYVTHPGIRILFHLTHTPNGICIDRIAYRDQNPYGSFG